MYSLTLSGRPTRGEPFLGNITRIASGWRRTINAVGGYGTGGFTIKPEDMSITQMVDFYEQNIGCIVCEYCAGMLSWEGQIVEMRLILDGMEHMRSLRPEWWHNKVQVRYTWPAVVDTEQGGAYDYDPDHPNDAFQDASQDFSDWETTSGDAVFRLTVTATDGTVSWGFMGDAFTTTNTDDSIHLFEDVERTDEGWATKKQNKAGLTVSSYTVERVDRSGGPTDTGWTTNSDSIDEYGQMEYVEVVGSLPTEVAEVLRDRHLTQYAWPRSRLIGSVVIGPKSPANRLVVAVAGFWHTLNYRYLSTSRVATCYGLIDYLISQSEFVTAGRLETNEWAAKADCDPVPQRLGDLCEDVINLGDAEGNIWTGGVYADKLFRYEEAPTTVEYHLKDDVLTDKAGVGALPPLVEPGFLVQIAGALPTAQPFGTSNIWDRSDVAYVEQVEFVAPDRLRLRLYGEEEMIITTLEQARMYGIMEG